MSSFFGLGRRKAIAGVAGAVVAAGALFAAGFFTASALESDGGGTPSDGAVSPPVTTGDGSVPRVGMVPPGMPSASGTNVPASYPGKGGAEDAARGGALIGVGLMPKPYCVGDLPGVLSDSTIDLSLAGFRLDVPGSGYVLRSIAVRAEGVCDDRGQPTGESVLVVDTTWVHSATGFEVYISQRQSAEALPSVLTPYNGQVWANGYFYTAWVNAYPVLPVDSVSRPPVDGPDPRGAEVLREVLGRLAPSVEERCYYVQRKGDWSDLAAMGIGDPRGAIPSGLSEQQIEIIAFTSPPADCNAPALVGASSFSASFGDARGGTQVYLSAYPIGPNGQPSYGYIDEGSAWWTNNTYGFNVGGWTQNGPIGREAVERIARALDPNFSAACFVSTRPLAESELAALGFRVPVAPEGFTITTSTLTATEAPGGSGCAQLPDAQYYPQYNLYWTMEGPDGATIEASAFRHPQSESGPGYIHENGLNWSDASGTQFSVYGYSKSGGRSAAVDRETLIAVAQSMDPTLDVSKLQEGPVVYDKPAPAAEAR
jgi:hypothetical protein